MILLAVAVVVSYKLAVAVARFRGLMSLRDVGTQTSLAVAVALDDLAIDAIKRRLARYGRGAVSNKGELMLGASSCVLERGRTLERGHLRAVSYSGREKTIA